MSRTKLNVGKHKLMVDTISRVGLEMAPARSHKPNDGGSNPSPATNGNKRTNRYADWYRNRWIMDTDMGILRRWIHRVYGWLVFSHSHHRWWGWDVG